MHASQNKFKSYPPPFNWIERYSLNNVDAFLARNEEAEQILRRKGYTGRIAQMPHGVDASQFTWERVAARESLGLDRNPVVGYVGALIPRKGLDTLIRACSTGRWNVLLVGDGPEKENLLLLARDVGIGDKVVISPAVNHREVARYIAAMDVFVLPSRAEPFGRVLIEAMAAGTAVVGSNSESIPRVIGDAGLVFPVDDVPALSQHLEMLITHPEERDRLIRKGKERVSTLYSWQRIADQTYGVYKDTLGRQ